MKIDHIGIVVKSIEKAIEYWEKVFGYKKLGSIIVNTRQQVSVVFLEKESSLPVKLVEPVNESSPVYRFSRKGGGLHHICFLVDDVVDEVDRQKGLGNRVLVPPQPGEAFGGENISFIHVKNCGNVEIIDTLNHYGSSERE